MNADLRQQLLAMVEEDRDVHAELTQSGEIFQGYAPRMAEVHQRNGQRLAQIIDAHGWPGTSVVGPDGAHAAWFILQHAIGLPGLQRRGLQLLKAAVARGEAAAAQAAYLEDRIAFFERRPQRYGTQFDWDEQGQLSPWLLADPERVDELRASVALEPLSQKQEQFRRETLAHLCPRDLAKHRAEAEAWARSVGWV